MVKQVTISLQNCLSKLFCDKGAKHSFSANKLLSYPGSYTHTHTFNTKYENINCKVKAVIIDRNILIYS